VITILAIFITWYLTKVYYTKSLRLRIEGVDADKLIKVKCSKCARSVFTVSENLRTPFYCSMCK
jgi:uncharacterized OB-fold protein